MIQDAQNLLRTTLANSESFQSLVDADDATAAALRIHHDEFPRPTSGKPVHTLAELTALRPCAVVYTPSSSGWMIGQDAMAGPCWSANGRLIAVIYRNVPEADKNDLGKVDTDFRVIVGNIASDLVEMSETAERLASRKITASGPYRTELKELNSIGDAQAYELEIEWGFK